MSFFLTLVAGDTPLTPAHLALVEGALDTLGLRFQGAPRWLKPHHAAELPIDDYPDLAQMAHLRAVLAPHKIDIFARNAATHPPRLFIADMDATILQGESLDEIAAHLGIGDQVAGITARAMRGELDFRDALFARLSLIAGAPESLLETIWTQMRFSKGAATLIQTLRAQHVHCVLVSGGFTFFTHRVAEALGFHRHHGNILTLENGQITPHLTDPLIDKNAKLNLLHDYALRHHLTLAHTVAIGDGANDLPMLAAAGMGIGYHPKPVLRETLTNQILYGDLTALLYALGLDYTQILHTPDPVPQ